MKHSIYNFRICRILFRQISNLTSINERRGSPAVKSKRTFHMVDYFAISVICVWYCSNIGVLLLNKYLLSVWGFRFPIFLTMLHMLSCFVLSVVVRCCSNSSNRQQIKSRKHMLKIAVLALVFVISVVGGNISLRFIPVSFNQAIGATTPFFTAMVCSCFSYIGWS